MANKAKSIYSHDYRDVPDAPLCGNLKPQPETSKNTLLSKPQLGAVKPAVYDLPSKADFQHEYGLRQFRDGITSHDVLGAWAQHHGTADQLAGRDFKQLNAEAAVAGNTTSRAFAQYRLDHDARLKAKSTKVDLPIPYNDSTCFGKSSMATTPISDLVSHSYRFEWQQSAPTAEESASAKKAKKPGQTKTSLLQAKVSHQKLLALEEKERNEAAFLDKTVANPESGLWKMTNFKQVPPKVGYTG